MKNLIRARSIKTFSITAITPDIIEAKSLPLHRITPKQIPVVFNSGSYYDHHFIIRVGERV